MSRTYRNETSANHAMQAHAEQHAREQRALKAFSTPAPKRARQSVMRKIARAFGI